MRRCKECHNCGGYKPGRSEVRGNCGVMQGMIVRRSPSLRLLRTVGGYMTGGLQYSQIQDRPLTRDGIRDCMPMRLLNVIDIRDISSRGRQLLRQLPK